MRGIFLTGCALIACTVIRVTILMAQVPQSRTVWTGVYSDHQAARGQDEYTAHCSGCHREDLSGYQGILTGAGFINEYGEGTLSRLFEQIKTTMPRGAAGSLSDQAYLEIVTYLLKANGFPAGANDLSADDLQHVQVMSKAGPEPVPNFALVQVMGCLVRNESGTAWLVTSATEPVRAARPQANPGELASLSTPTPGTATFELLLSAAYAPDQFRDHTVEIRGFLIRR